MKITNLLTVVLAVLFISAGVNTLAQDKKENVKTEKKGCCSTEHSHKSDSTKMDHSKMDHSKMDHSKMSESKSKITTEKAAATAWNQVCPVLGNEVDAETPTVEYNGKVYGFCCPGCDSKFSKNPEKYSQNLSEDGKEFIKNKK